MPSLKLTLIIVGAALEVVGLLLTASPELAPRWQRLRRFGAERIRRLLRRPRHYVMGAGAGGLVLDGRATGYVSVPEGAPLERQLAFLREQAEQAQQRLDELEDRVADLPGEWRKDVETTRAALEGRITEELEHARELFIVQRFIGLTCIASGSVVLAVVNLL